MTFVSEMSGGAAAETAGAVIASGMARIAAVPMLHSLRIMLLGLGGEGIPRSARAFVGRAPYNLVVRRCAAEAARAVWSGAPRTRCGCGACGAGVVGRAAPRTWCAARPGGAG
ncbi:hypothetical protein GCM10010140_39660 [Streptosporangium pseudovulgare]|uniref:Uncharacterized protein n=1 Tax=Streptosporangium pseudovulgare TaxID=35765 RepID=A0ABQ2R1N9_9ACTN|nr:hypothetical protein GCM10010140_39660 [Streptosporangium pseudovulgare]